MVLEKWKVKKKKKSEKYCFTGLQILAGFFNCSIFKQFMEWG